MRPSRTVVHLELPWTPTTIEQRVGRVDRIGQRHTVHVHHLAWESALEGGVLRRLIQRAGLSRRAVGESEVPDWLAVGAAILGVVPPSVRRDDATGARCAAVRSARCHSACVQHPGNGASATVGVAVGTSDDAGTIRPASDRVRRVSRDPWPHSVVIAYRIAARAASGHVAAHVVVPVRVEFAPEILSRASLECCCVPLTRSRLRRRSRPHVICCGVRSSAIGSGCVPALARAQEINAAIAREYGRRVDAGRLASAWPVRSSRIGARARKSSMRKAHPVEPRRPVSSPTPPSTYALPTPPR